MVNSVPDSKGQYTGSAHNVGAAHPLGPYAPKSAGRPSGVPGPSGQYDHATVKEEPKDKTMGAKTSSIPGSDGQYPHTKYDGGGSAGKGVAPHGGNDAGMPEHTTSPKGKSAGVKPGDGGHHGGVW